MINCTESHIHDFDGCMYGLTTQFGDRPLPIKKPWRLVSWGAKFNLHKKCDRKHEHGKCEGRETEITQTYTEQIVDIILKAVRRRMTNRVKESLSKLGETCGDCRHDRRSTKKVAVSIVEESSGLSMDQEWLRRHVEGLNVRQLLSQHFLWAFQEPRPPLIASKGEVNPGALRLYRGI